VLLRTLVVLSTLLAAGLLVPQFPSADAAAPPIRPPVPAPRWMAQRVMELTGSNRVVVALGDPGTARHIAILVPGVGNDVATFDDPAHPDQRPYGMALALRATAPDTAVIAWLGYRTPAGLDRDALTGRLAQRGARSLRAFVADVRTRAAAGATISLVCHSYGSVVCGLAAHGLPVNNLVFLGSPGVRAASVAALRSPATVYAATAATDWIRWVPHIRIGDYGHGPDPTGPSFGARRLPTAGVSGHDGYFAPGSVTLRAVAALVSQERRS
jgi:hypothetical protein